MKLFKHLILLVVLFALLLPFQAAHADIAPPPSPVLTGLQPFEYQNTKVQMVYERVEMELQMIQKPGYDHLSGRVAVKASFVMHNQGKLPETMQSIFPLESLSDCMFNKPSVSYAEYKIDPDSFAITVDGMPVSLHPVTTAHPYKDTNQLCEEMNWVGFDVTFPVDEDVLITVSYNMDGGGDAMQIFDYVLETGAAWYGPIEQAYVVVKLPYIVTKENILADTTPGYQFLYNEIFWSFQELEPTSKDNIHIEIISPGTWQSILSLRQRLKENPKDPETWLELAQTYDNISVWHGSNLRNRYFYDLVAPTYQRAIELNPNNARLHGYYAELLWVHCCFYVGNGIEDADLNKILTQVNLALSLDPEQYPATEVVGLLKAARPGLDFTPPTTIPPTATPLISETPTAEPSETSTPLPSSTLQVEEVIVVQTRIVTAPPANTAAPSPTLRPSSTPTLTVIPPAQPAPVSNGLIWPLLIVAGFVAGALVMRRKL